jgi:hypothetical protein
VCPSPLNPTLRTSVVAADSHEHVLTVIWSQKPPLHAEDGINDLLLLRSCHGGDGGSSSPGTALAAMYDRGGGRKEGRGGADAGRRMRSRWCEGCTVEVWGFANSDGARRRVGGCSSEG